MQALDFIVNGLQRGKSDMGIVVGTNFMATLITTTAFRKLGAFSPDVRYKYYNARAKWIWMQ